MISHAQFLQDVEVIGMMYQSLDGLRHDRVPKSRQWHAVMAGGPMEQIGKTLPEMHEYLRLPYPLPASPPQGADPAPVVAKWEDFGTVLETYLRLYRALGVLQKEIGQFRPGLYATLAGQFVPHLQDAQTALHDYLGWREVEVALDEMERKFAAEPVNGAAGEAVTPAAESRP
jgi:hypothetical protein